LKLVYMLLYVTLASAFLVFIGLFAIIAATVQLTFYSLTPPAPLKPQLGREDLPISSMLGIFQPAIPIPRNTSTACTCSRVELSETIEEKRHPKEGAFIAMMMLEYVFGAILTGILLTIA